MKRKTLTLLAACALPFFAFAQQQIYQLSDGGTPWGAKFTQFDEEIPVTRTAEIDLDQLAAEDAITDEHKSGPWRFGYNHFVNLNLNNSGAWKTLENGDKIWRLAITCPGALTVNLGFQYVSMPEGARLFVYNKDRSVVLGAFSQKHISPDLMFGTELINGETVIVEYFVPAESTTDGSLEVFRITHGYRGVQTYIDRGFGTSGACENNARCFRPMTITSDLL